MAKLNPYLNFDNKQCREAMNFYKDCLGGELSIQIVKDTPEMAAMMPADFADHVMHAKLESGDMVIMGSDLNRGPAVEGNMASIVINCDSEEQLNEFFSKLSNGGKVSQPIADMPWGAKYGDLTDKFGKNWALNWQKA